MKKAYSALILVLFSAFPAFAQVPTGSLIHLQGDVGVVDSLGKVKEWRDAGNPNIKFLPPALANRPTHSASINGHQSITFDGVANYLEGPNIFPVNQDYTLCVVVRINNFALSNNLVSGNTHALFFSGNSPYMLHANFNTLAGSTIPLSTSPAIIVANFNQSNQYASFSINGSPADSAFIGTNTDTAMYIGAYSRSSFLGGDIAEIFIYPRYLSDTERVHLEQSLFKKYNIPGPQPPDLTFTECPHPLELYPRENDDSATVKIKATLTAKGFDSVYVKVLKNSESYSNYSAPLKYNSEGASFSFTSRIHAELSEYSFIIGVKSSSKDSIMRRRDSILCGDVVFVDGQSNSIVGGDSYTNEFCRTFGYNFSHSRADTLWSLSSAAGNGGGPNVGAFPMRIQRNFVENLKIPIILISGGVGGTPIESHLPNDLNPMDLQTIYGSMLYRANKSGLASKAKALFWYQGESNTIANYFDNFKRLYNAWHLDYPNLEKIYVVQVRPGCNSGNAGEVRELLRSLSDFYPDIVTHSTMALPGHDGCHFLLDLDIGYHILGDQLYSLLVRDFYDKDADTTGINSPNIVKAFYTGDDHRTIGLVFNTGGSGLVVPKDTAMYGLQTSIKDYFYIGSDTGLVTSIQVKGDTLLLQLSRSSDARNITYLPDQNYNNTAINYEGPWVTNHRGVGAFSFWRFPITYHLDVLSPDIAVGENPFIFFPNPASGFVKLRINLGRRENIRITLFDELGRELMKVIDEEQNAGSYVLNLDTSPFASSSVIVRTEIGKETYQSRLVLIH